MSKKENIMIADDQPKGASKKAKENPITTIQLTQQLDEAYWWNYGVPTDDEMRPLRDAIQASIDTGNVRPVGNYLVVERLNRYRLPVTNYSIPVECVHAILHDKDTREVWSEALCQYVVETKPPHIHMIIRLRRGSGAPNIYLNDIARALNVEPQYLEKPKAGKYGYDNMLSYLIHIKNRDKYQYDPKLVSSYVVQRDDGTAETPLYCTIYAERRAEWEKGCAKVDKQRAVENIDTLESKILRGEVSKSQVVLTDEYYEVYSRYCRRCEDAFHVYGERRAYKTIEALQRGEYKLSVLFVTGQAGSGKTRMAKELCNRLIEDSRSRDDTWRLCSTASTNPMDDYNGEEILLMDDVRGSAMTASDWLKLLDPYNTSPASARYRNKQPACRVIVITSTKEPIEFFSYCKQIGGGDRSEALDQFMRRIQCLTRVIKADRYEDATAYIGDSKQVDSYSRQVSSTDYVQLSYSFDDGSEYGIKDAVEHLAVKVAENNDLLD